LVVVKARQRLSIGKRGAQKFGRIKYQVKFSNRFAALENFDDDDTDISMA